MSGLAWRLARRELRGGLRGFRVFLICLALGVMAMAAVGTIRAAITGGLTEQGATLLGGDAVMRFTYRTATQDERAFMGRVALKLSEVIDFRSMVVVGDETALAQVKAVGDAHPLIGAVQLDPPAPIWDSLAPQDGTPSALSERVLADRLGLKIGDRFTLGLTEFRLAGIILHEPDSAVQGINLGPRVIVRRADLDGSGLIGPGSIYESEYRMLLPSDADLGALKEQAQAEFKDNGMRWLDRRRPAPRIERFVERLGAFLTLVGLAGMAVGGVGISAAVRAFLESKISTIATLKTLGAQSGLIFRIYLLQIAVLSVLGVVIGVTLGTSLPLLIAPVIAASLPFPVAFGLYPQPLIEAGFYGITTAFLFTLLPLAQAQLIRAAALYRGAHSGVFPGWKTVLGLIMLAALLLGGAVAFTGLPTLTLSVAGGVAAALLVLGIAAIGLRKGAKRMARARFITGRPMLRLALAAIGGPRSEASAVILSLGLGLTVLAAIGQIGANLRQSITTDLPERAPAFFFIDIQPTQIESFVSALQNDPEVRRVETAPVLRGVLNQINGKPANEVSPGHWVVTGDRGVTYAPAPSSGTKITAGQWWPADYQGPPQVSFAAEEAAEMGLVLGDTVTVNILGRDITATITSLREVDFSTGGLGFVMTFNPSALAGAPHSHIATVYTDAENEARILRQTAKAMPNVTAIRVRDAIDRVSEAMRAIASATAWASAATLLTGFAVLIGSAAAGERARIYEAAIAKVLGASRPRILASFALRSALMGAAAGGVAVAAGGLAGWGVMRFVMDSPYRFELGSALMIVFGGAALTLVAGMVFALRPLATPPARVLRAQD